jgi:3-phosphoshikimate 1-carboxyvinyltransferase
MKKLTISPSHILSGSLSIPGDKSISHRALMFSSLANGTSYLENLLEGHDCIATLQVMRALGVHIELKNKLWIIKGGKKFGLMEPVSVLNCKNSGTTIRLMAGLLSGMPFMSILDGSDQIKTRPMERIIMPLAKMQAKIFGRNHNRLAPLVILPAKLVGQDYVLPIKSAQVKSALLLAGLFADKPCEIFNTSATRDHTEKLLDFMGADIVMKRNSVAVSPLKGELKPISLSIPGDISSAAFLLVAGVLLAKEIILKNVGVNPTRTGLIDALNIMGANIQFHNERSVGNEPVADIYVQKSSLVGKTFSGTHIVRMIDEIPILALAATQAKGKTIIKDAHELKVKESNRIARTVELLGTLGAHIEATEDGMIIHGKSELHGGEVSSFGDHRMALFLSIAGLIAKTPVTVSNAEVIDDSFPGFIDVLTQLGAQAKEGF